MTVYNYDRVSALQMMALAHQDMARDALGITPEKPRGPVIIYHGIGEQTNPHVGLYEQISAGNRTKYVASFDPFYGPYWTMKIPELIALTPTYISWK